MAWAHAAGNSAPVLGASARRQRDLAGASRHRLSTRPQLTGGCTPPPIGSLAGLCHCILTAHPTFHLPVLPPLQTRGNQRDTDRARAQKRNEKNAKDKNDDGMTPLQRKERDAKALQEKLAKKAAAEAAAKK